MNVKKRFGTLLAVSLCAIAGAVSLEGCRKSGDQAPTGQVIAHVGPDVVTMQELENEFRLANIPQDKRSDAVTRSALREIVVRKYLAQQAVAAKIDREPTTLLSAMRAKEQLLETTFLRRRLDAKATEIGKAEIAKYIGEHPTRFAGRQLLNIDQVNVVPGQKAKALVDATKNAKTLAEIEKKSDELGVLHDHSSGQLDSSTLPESMVKLFEQKGADELFFMPSGANGVFFKIVSKRTVPVEGEEANARALQALKMQLLREEQIQAVKDAGATTSYEGDYAKIMSDAASTAPAPAAAPAAESGTDAGAGAEPGAPQPAAETGTPKAMESSAEPPANTEPQPQPKPAAKPKAPAKPKAH